MIRFLPTLMAAMLCASAAFAEARIIVIQPDGTTIQSGDAPKEEAAPEPEERHLNEGSSVRLQGLNKVTARSSLLTAKVGEAIAFDTLQITALRCASAPADETPESAALLDIQETHDQSPSTIFLGWMFASSPALSALEHPVYDVRVVGCE